MMGTTRLRVILAEGQTYDIRVGHRLLTNLGVHLREACDADEAVVVTDANVAPHYLARVVQGLRKADIEASYATVPAGEDGKSVEVASGLWDELAARGTGRDGLLVALGGGTVGDLTGFVASTYMRGIDLVQVPTTLLAMVDSSIGGKTAVNLEAGKNLVGTFNQPVYVACDLTTLATLPQEEWGNGLAEIAKMALLDGREFYEWLGNSAKMLAVHDEATVQQAIVQSLSFKARVVAADEKEQTGGQRECLNYGHTFAHALEAASGFTIPHGLAVAEGMRFAARLAVEAVGNPQKFADDQDALLDSLGLTPVLTPYEADVLFEHMQHDKKVRHGNMRFIFCESPGKWEAAVVDPDLVKIYLILWEQARM
jgi:3-dehydroquinate synthase